MWFGKGLVGGGSVAFGTLLGPEATGAWSFGWSARFVWVVRGVWFLGFLVFLGMTVCSLLWGAGGVLLGLLFENCIVDASILKFCVRI